MQVSVSGSLGDGRPVTAIGRIRAVGPWRAAGDKGVDADRETAIETLKREAEDFGADAVIDARFEIEGCRSWDIDGLELQRMVVTGLAVRFAEAA